jgi:hypothetical protein
MAKLFQALSYIDQLNHHAGKPHKATHLFTSGDALGVKAIRPDAVVLQKPFREADLILGIQRALDAVR